MARSTRFLIALVLLLFVMAGSCDRSADNQCRKFAVASGSFDECTWKRSQADELCRQLGYAKFWGEIEDTACGDSDTLFIVSLTCCTK